MKQMRQQRIQSPPSTLIDAKDEFSYKVRWKASIRVQLESPNSSMKNWKRDASMINSVKSSTNKVSGEALSLPPAKLDTVWSLSLKTNAP